MEEEMSTGAPLSPTDVLKSSSSTLGASTTTTTNIERAIVPSYVPLSQRPRPSMVEILLQRLVQDPNTRVAPCSPEIIEEIMMDQPPQAQAVEEEKKDAEQSLQIQKDKAGSSKAD